MSLIRRNMIQFSLPRSGGTFLYQILKMIFSNVKTTHTYAERAEVIVYRNFLDTAVSLHRVEKRLNDDFIINTEEELMFCINRHLRDINELFRYENIHDNYLIFNYEDDIYLADGQNNYDKIFNKIEKHFNIEITNKDDIIENTNFALNKKRSELFKDFRGVDEDTKIHGKHVSTGNIGIWKNHISDDLH